ncbi:MAG TPA: hypothetical protein VLJ40_05385 [Arthrobacter sp.]|nr:hypothetical protein [Arthrobacter sp.]
MPTLATGSATFAVTAGTITKRLPVTVTERLPFTTAGVILAVAPGPESAGVPT